MLTQEQIEQLEAFDAQGARVLSVYLDLDPASQIRRSYRIACEDLVKALRARLEGQEQADLSREVERVQTWLDSQDPRGKGLAVFSCTPRGLWHASFFAVRVMNHLAFEPTPDVAPLLRLVDEYERYAVAVVDKERARLFTVFLGEIEEMEEFKDFVIGKHRQGGVSDARYQRHHETHVYWHLKRVAQRLAELHRRRPLRRVVPAGPGEGTTRTPRVFPRAPAHRVAGAGPPEGLARGRGGPGKTTH